MGGRNPDQRRRWCRLAGAQGRHQLTVVGTFKRRPGNIFDPHAGHAIAFEFKKFSGPVGDIDEPVTVVRAPVSEAMSNTSPLAVSRPWKSSPYQEAMPSSR